MKEIKKVLGLKRLKEIEEENKKTARLGLQKIWELSETHPFHEAGVKHDLAYLIAYDLAKIGESKLARNHVKQADKEFIDEIHRIADDGDSIWLKFKATLFSGLVSGYSYLRF